MSLTMGSPVLADSGVAGLVSTADQVFGAGKKTVDRLRTLLGSSSDVAIGPSGDDNTGFQFPAADTINAYVGGALGLQITSSRTTYLGDNFNVNNAGVITAIEAALATANILGTNAALNVLRVKGAAAQAGDFFRIENSAGQVLWNLDTTGDVRQTLSSLRVRDIYINNNANVRLTDGGNALQISGQVASPSYFSSTSPSTAFYASQNGGFCAQGTMRMWSETQGNAAGETAARVGYIGAGVVADARLLAFAELVFGTPTDFSAIMGNGEFEHFVAGAGIVLKSPDGTRHRLTVSNAHALVITTL